MDKKYCLGLYEKAMPGNLTCGETDSLPGKPAMIIWK